MNAQKIINKICLLPASIRFGSCLALSAWLSFTLALSLGLENPYWAAMPVWVIFQNSRGALFERALYRILGSCLGALIGLLIIILPLPALLQLTITALLIAITVTASHILRGTLAYGALMVGITCIIVVLPSVVAVEHTLDLALARIACTLIGSLVVTLILGLFTPHYPRQLFTQQLHLFSSDVIFYASQMLSITDESERADLEQTLFAHLLTLNNNAALAVSGSLKRQRRLHYFDALLAAALDVMAASRALQTCLFRGESVPNTLGAELEQLAKQISQSDRIDNTQYLYYLQHWRGGEGESINEIKRLAYTIEQLLIARDRLLANYLAKLPPLSSPFAHYLLPHRDWPFALHSALSASLLTLVTSSFFYLSQWHFAELAALGIGIFATVLGAMPEPQKIAPKLLLGVCCGVLLALVYRFTVQPYFTETLGVSLTLLPFILLGGYFRANPRTALPAIDANMCFMLASQAGLGASSSWTIVSDGLAFIVSALLVNLFLLLIPVRPDKQARYATHSIRRDLLRLLTNQAPLPQQGYYQSTRQLLRLMLHLTRAGKVGENAPDGLLSTLNLSYLIIQIKTQQQQYSLDSPTYLAIEQTFVCLANLLRHNRPWLAPLEPLQLTTRSLTLLIETFNDSIRFIKAL